MRRIKDIFTKGPYKSQFLLKDSRCLAFFKKIGWQPLLHGKMNPNLFICPYHMLWLMCMDSSTDTMPLPPFGPFLAILGTFWHFKDLFGSLRHLSKIYILSSGQMCLFYLSKCAIFQPNVSKIIGQMCPFPGKCAQGSWNMFISPPSLCNCNLKSGWAICCC